MSKRVGYVMSNEIFSPDILGNIFKRSSTHPDRIISKEKKTLEFKETYGWESLLTKHLRTCAAFANTKGGYIVFGVKNNPRFLVGLQGKKLTQFQDLDPERLSNTFNTYFAPEISFELHEHILDEKTFGILYIFASKNKPIVCCKAPNAGDIREGDIFYRYGGRTERIKYPELRELLDENRAHEQNLWMRHLKTIATAGVRDIGIFDLNSGIVSGSGDSFIIDESLLEKVSFIKEGEFVEHEGSPTLKLIGEVRSTTSSVIQVGSKKIKTPTAITEKDILDAFLLQKFTGEPDEYIRKMATENSCYLPVYYYIDSAHISKEDAIKMIKSLRNSGSAKRLISRLENCSKQYCAISTEGHVAAKNKREYREKLLAHQVDINTLGDFSYFLQSVRGLTIGEILGMKPYLLEVLKNILDAQYATSSSILKDNLRKAICWVDEALYMPKHNSEIENAQRH